MRITKVYTRTGDDGTTRLVGGAEVSKASDRIEAYGAVDELNAAIGLVSATASQGSETSAALADIIQILARAGNDLFNLGGELATPPDQMHPDAHCVGPDDIADLEGSIDSINETLPPLTEFILPTGKVGALFHQARTICRRAERRVVALQEHDPQALRPGSCVVPYLNRLSDWLFVAGRGAAREWAEPESQWDRG